MTARYPNTTQRSPASPLKTALTDAYQGFLDLMATPLGRFVLVGLTLSLFYHLANGLRHLFWDAGLGLSVTASNQSGIMAMAFSVVATITVWAIGLGPGGP